MSSMRQYRLTIWYNDEKFDWRYELPTSNISRKHQIKNNTCVPVDDWPDRLMSTSMNSMVGCEFVASNDEGDGMAGVIDEFRASGTVISLDPSHPASVTGDQFGQMRVNAGGQQALPGLP